MNSTSYSTGTRIPSPSPAFIPLPDTPLCSNAELLAHAERSNDPLLRELAARYAAALGLLHSDALRYAPLDT